MTHLSREDRDEHALILFSRMFTRRTVWVDSPANQPVYVQMIGLDDDGEVVVYDHEGNDRRAEEYQLEPRQTKDGHCWHSTGHTLNDGPPTVSDKCCRCGKERWS